MLGNSARSAPALTFGQGQAVWRAAAALIGTPFRLHGRNPAFGLDCLGLVIAAHAAAGIVLPFPPPRYRLRGPLQAQWQAWADMCGTPVSAEVAAVGDVLLIALPHDGDTQWHLAIAGAIAAEAGVIHAHAGLGRVVFSPGTPDGHLAGRWRAQVGETLWQR